MDEMSSTFECCATLIDGDIDVDTSMDLARAYGALSDPIRLRLLAIVSSSDEVCSCTLEGPLERSQPTISHHTRVLSDAGLLIGEKRGRWVYWRANHERIAELRAVLNTEPVTVS